MTCFLWDGGSRGYLGGKKFGGGGHCERRDEAGNGWMKWAGDM